MDRKYTAEELKSVNLKKGYFIRQYVDLRNSYRELLLTSSVNLGETRKWLKRKDIEVYGVVQDNILLGAVILYINRDGEIALFARDPDRKIGSRLIGIIEEVAREKNLRFVRGWVLKDNSIAQKVFKKNGFEEEGTSKRKYKGIVKTGVKYKKLLKGNY